MSKHRKLNTPRLLSQLSSLSITTPQVIAHRVSRMASASPVLSARDRREFTGMVVEKQVAFARSVQNMRLAGAKVNQELLVAWSRAMIQPQWLKPAAGSRLARQVNQSGLSVLSEALAPIERKASANARRLSRRKKR